LQGNQKIIKQLIIRIISFLPTNFLRVAGYKVFCRYSVMNSTIGFGTLINVSHFEIRNSKLGKFNRILGPMKLIIKSNSFIGPKNTFQCSKWAAKKLGEESAYACSMEIQENTLITGNHLFNTTGKIVIGSGSWIAGAGSQFWTHGAGSDEFEVVIGKNCYVGSAVRFSPGSAIGDNVIVGMGSVVTKKIKLNNCLLAGVPAKVARENYDWKSKKNL